MNTDIIDTLVGGLINPMFGSQTTTTTTPPPQEQNNNTAIFIGLVVAVMFIGGFSIYFLTKNKN